MFDILLMILEEEERNRILALWQKNGSALVHYARKELGPAGDDAEDVVSEAFERLMIHYDRYGTRTDEQMNGLLLRMVRNLCMDAHRKRNQVSAVFPISEIDAEDLTEDVTDPGEQTPEEFVVSDDNVRRMKAVIRSLTPALKDVLEMRLIEDMTNREIAEELGIPETVVRQRLSRARKNVAAKWEEEEHE